MPVDYPDFGVPETSGAYPLMGDLGELAARLGSIVIFDRRGRVFDLDDCESPLLKWKKANYGTSTALLDSTNPKSGGQCIKLTHGAAANNYISIEKRLPVLASDRVGFEYCFSYPSTYSYLDTIIYKYTTTKLIYGEVRLDINAHTLSYRSGDTAWTLIATLDAFYAEEFTYHPIKVVVDFDTEKYVRCLFAGTEYDLSAISMYTVTFPYTPRLTFQVKYTRRATGGAVIYVDDFILTQDEP